MAGRNLYVVLGVSPGANMQRIRSAYHRRARELHPDIAGPDSAEAFRELNEAYETLSHPARRDAYDQNQWTAVSRRVPRRDTGPDLPVPEMLVPEPISLLGCREAIHPSFEALHARVLLNFGGGSIPKSERPEPINFDVLLSATEAARGGIVPLAVPVMVPCARCDGVGSIWMFHCPLCEGSGRIEEARTLAARIPPATRDGEVFDYPLKDLGYRNLYLRLHIAVTDQVPPP